MWRWNIRYNRHSKRFLEQSSEHSNIRSEKKFVDFKFPEEMLVYRVPERPPPVNFMPLVSSDE
jgi:hypothetical protein